jgi:hypothetical protein
MNPLGLLVLCLGILIIIVGVKGSQHNLVSALTNKPATKSTTSSTTTSGTPGTLV